MNQNKPWEKYPNLGQASYEIYQEKARKEPLYTANMLISNFKFTTKDVESFMEEAGVVWPIPDSKEP